MYKTDSKKHEEKNADGKKNYGNGLSFPVLRRSMGHFSGSPYGDVFLIYKASARFYLQAKPTPCQGNLNVVSMVMKISIRQTNRLFFGIKFVKS